MIANELMIDDWVRCRTDKKPFKVEQIDGIEEQVYGDDGFFVDIADLEPIPITEDFLEKNGFQRMERKDAWSGKIHVQYMLEIGNMDSVIYVPDSHCLFAKHMLGETFEIDNVKSVHEMQHALRIGEFNHININL